MSWTVWKKTGRCFWSLISIGSFQDDFICWKTWLNSCMNACCFSREPAGVQSFLRNNKLQQHTYLPCWLWKESLPRLSRFPCVWVLCVFWLTPIPLTVLCVSTGSWRVVGFSHGSGACVALSCGPGCFLRRELRLVSQVFLGTTFQYHRVARVV